ncbi:hypothetical protein GCM10009754_52740 [Amycolatopsis minnesotensis]|uniref:Uncharacterized protein n=1 Tax=Amycolatopsis minnesotensis TaxID=337894 RepID=A0ABP5D384_9PSEU
MSAEPRRRPLTAAEMEALAANVAGLLRDLGADLTRESRALRGRALAAL